MRGKFTSEAMEEDNPELQAALHDLDQEFEVCELSFNNMRSYLDFLALCNAAADMLLTQDGDITEKG